ncbi:MAG: hypothetical protein Q4G33_10770 [bacterium]|nr:hypothetical protein [bacterium]
MKNIYKQMLMTALALSAAVSCTVIASAEGSRDLTKIDNSIISTDTTAQYPAYRPYLDWRDRSQFGMASKNVVYAYANQGETVYFGSSVTEASDRSIEAVVHSDVEFTSSLSITDPSLKGASIAVTLPVSDGADEAFNPEGQGTDIYTSGSNISSGNSGKVYLFKPDKTSKTGYIENTSMEAAGPDIDGSNPEGYAPLSFTAPLTGTYSFRFLSPKYSSRDVEIITPTMKPDNEAYISIDFGTASSSALDKDVSYWQDNIGYVTLHNESGRGNSVKALESDTDVAGITYPAGHKYLSNSKASTEKAGSIEFTPLHSCAAIEVTWAYTNTNNTKRILHVKQGNNESKSQKNAVGEYVTRIDSINGSSIKSGEPVKIWISENESQIYEIKYIYDKTTPAKLVPSKYHSIDFSSLEAQDTAKESGDDETITDDVIGEVKVYSKVGRGYRVADLSEAQVTLYGKTYSGKRIGLYSQSNPSGSFPNTLDENGNATDNTHSAVGFVPQHDNASVEIVWTMGSDTYNAVLNAYSNGEVTELGQITSGGLDEPAKSTLTGLTANSPVYIYATKGYPRIYEIKYIYPGEIDYAVDNLQQVSEATTWNNFSIASYTAASLVDGYDTMRVYADENNKVEYNSDHPGEIDFRGIGNFLNGKPTSRVLEINPKTAGIVEVGFGGGGSGSPRKLVIEQNGVVKGSAIRNKGGNENTVAKAYVDADIPVYIYSSDYTWNPEWGSETNSDGKSNKGYNVYISSVSFTPENLEPLARKVDQPWANSASEVAAWDVTVASSGSNEWNIYDLFNGVTEHTTKKGIKFYSGGSKQDVQSITVNGESISGLKVDPIVYNANGSIQKNVFEFTPSSSGTVKVYAWKNSGQQLRRAVIEQDGIKQADTPLQENNSLTEVTAQVAADKTVSIYTNPKWYDTDNNEQKATGGIYFYKIEFIPAEGQNGVVYTHEGRVWTDILFLNSGNYQRSIYSNVNILTKDGFLYNVNLNGIQPYSFIFYANNRGYLYDRWGVYSDKTWNDYGVENTSTYLQPLERSFYSKGNSDVGDPPEYRDLAADGSGLMYKNKDITSYILPNYIPTDTEKEKDYTHKIFLNPPEYEALGATTGNSYLRGNPKNPLPVQEDLFENGGIVYTGMGSSGDNSGDVSYGTEGIGGRFDITLSRIKNTDGKWWTTALLYGIDNVSLTLDFSEYKLDENNKPVLNAYGEWEKSSDTTDITDSMKNNKITLTATLEDEEPIEADTKPDGQHYTLAWNGRDAYGNIVPPGIYTNNLCDCTMMGVAHFPILDAEHNPNGIKMQLANTASVSKTDGTVYDPFDGKRDYVYYNNSAVSPKLESSNTANSTAWLYKGYSEDEKDKYPSKIGDGLNKAAGISSNYSAPASQGAMSFGDYTEADDSARNAVGNSLESGYGNFAALDLWIKYSIDYPKEFSIGVNKAQEARNYAYVSYVANEKVAVPEVTPGPTYTTVYQFGKGNNAPDINLEHEDGTVPYTQTVEGSNAYAISVNTENGKLSNSDRTDEWAQINAGTILTLPNVHKGTTLTFVLYQDTGLIIDGTTYKNGESYTTVKNGSVVMTATGTQTYIATITVTGESFITETTEPTPAPNPLDDSHVGYWDMKAGVYEFEKKYTSNYGKTIYGSTISTGFTASVPVASADGETYINWTITIPTGDGETRTFIKDPGFTDLNFDTSGNEEQLAFLNELLSSAEWAADMTENTDEGTGAIGDELDFANNSGSELNSENDSIDMSVNEEAENDVQWIIDEISILSETGYEEQLTAASNSLTANVGDTAVTDGDVQINKGTIYPVNSFGSSNGNSVQIKLRYKLPSMTTITNTNITVGLVIDNLYAPGAYVTVNGGVTTGDSSGYDEFTHGESGTVTAESYEEGYRDNAANPYNKAKEAISE